MELRFSDDVDQLMHLELMAATEELARDLAARFQKNPEQVYTQLMNALFSPQ